jgi:hypothetical protein
LQPSSTTVNASRSYPLINQGDQFGQPTPPVIADFRSDTGSIAIINHFPWDDPTHELKTNSGGTFISGNVNYIHAAVVPPGKTPISLVLLHFYLGFADISVGQATRQTNNYPPPSRIFQGRQTIRDEMNDFFNQEIRKQHIYVLYGLGGAGKTQIALKFISDSSW